MNSQNADKLIIKGKNELSRFRLTGNKYRDALKYFKPAINIYKYNKEWEKCAEILILCLECPDEEKIHQYHDIADCYQHIDQNKYIEWTNKMIQQAALEGKFDMMAKAYHKLGDLYDKNKDNTNALKHYQQVLSLQEINRYIASIHRIKQRMAELYIEEGNYAEALKLLKDVLCYYEQTDTLKWFIDNILLSIIMIYIGMDDEIMAKRMIEEYTNTFPKFVNSLEYAFVENIISFLNQNDAENLDICIYKYQKLKKLKPIHSILLDKIKVLIKKDDEIDLC